jgi:hypothetical protein
MEILIAILVLYDAEATERTTQYFSAQGFNVEISAPKTLTLDGSPEVFEKLFEVVVGHSDELGAFVTLEGETSHDFPLTTLPEDIRVAIQAIGFEEPIGFGPTDY